MVSKQIQHPWISISSNEYSTNKKAYHSFECISQWSHTKALLGVDSPSGTCYKDYVTFSIEKYTIWVYIYFTGYCYRQELNKRVAHRENNYPHDHDFIYQLFCYTSGKYKKIRAFFALQDATMNVPDVKNIPNLKVLTIIK